MDDELGACPVCGAPSYSCADQPSGVAIVRLGDVEGPMYTLDRKLWMTADGTIVEDGDPAAATLYGVAGDEIAEAEAERLGLVAKPKAAKAGTKQKVSPVEAAEEA